MIIGVTLFKWCLFFGFVSILNIYSVVAIHTEQEHGFAYPVVNFTENSQMCTTTSDSTDADCTYTNRMVWSSCAASTNCPLKDSSCSRLKVDVRNPGQNIRLEGCQNVQAVECTTIPDYNLECHKGDCQYMDGLIECTSFPTLLSNHGSITNFGARCRNLTSVLSCQAKNYQPQLNCNKIKNCVELFGMYQCYLGGCKKLTGPRECKRVCGEGLQIGDADKSVIVRQPNGMFMAKCERALGLNSFEIWPLNFVNDGKISNLLIFCSNVRQHISTHGDLQPLTTVWELSDCFNGTLLAPDYYGNKKVTLDMLIHTQMEFTEVGVLLRGLQRDNGLIGLTETDLKIVSNVKFYVNKEGCAESVDECTSVTSKYGQPLTFTEGSDNLFRSSFRCHYTNKNLNSASSKLFQNYATIISVSIIWLFY